MRHLRLLLALIFIITILTTLSSAAIVTEKQCANLFAPNGKLVDWTDKFQFNKFDPSKGKLLSVEFNATLNGTINASVENLADEPVTNASISVNEKLSVEMLGGQKLYLAVNITTGTFDVEKFEGACLILKGMILIKPLMKAIPQTAHLRAM